MSGLEINRAIREKYLRIQQLTSPEFFVLNVEVQQLLKEISELQDICPHETIIDNICADCYLDVTLV